MGTKKGAFMAKGRHSKGRHRDVVGQLPQTAPSWIRHCQKAKFLTGFRSLLQGCTTFSLVPAALLLFI